MYSLDKKQISHSNSCASLHWRSEMQPSPTWRTPVTRFCQSLSYSPTSVYVMSLWGSRSITQMILFNLELRIRCLYISFFHFGFLVLFIFFVQCPIHFSPLFPFLVKPWLFPLTNGQYRQFHSAEAFVLPTFRCSIRLYLSYIAVLDLISKRNTERLCRETAYISYLADPGFKSPRASLSETSHFSSVREMQHQYLELRISHWSLQQVAALLCPSARYIFRLMQLFLAVSFFVQGHDERARGVRFSEQFGVKGVV